MKLRPKSSDGSSALHDFLQNYRRITIVEACEYRIDEQDASNIAIWVKESGRWRQLRDVAQRLQRVKFQHDKSACQSIITALFDLSYSQYRTMRESFEQTGLTDAGIYVRDDEDVTKPEFVIAVELPNEGRAMRNKAMSGGLGAAAGLALGVAGTLGGRYLLNRKSDESFDDDSEAFEDNKQGASGAKPISDPISQLEMLLKGKTEELKDLDTQNQKLKELHQRHSSAQSQIDIDNRRLRKEVREQAALLQILNPFERRVNEIMTAKLDSALKSQQNQIAERNKKQLDVVEKNKILSPADKLRSLYELNKTLDPNVVVADMKQIFEQNHGDFLIDRAVGLSKELATDWFEAYWLHILRSFQQNKSKPIDVLMKEAKNKMEVDVPLLLKAVDAQTAIENYMKKLTLEYYFGVMER
jgi:hypothetical protein